MITLVTKYYKKACTLKGVQDMKTTAVGPLIDVSSPGNNKTVDLFIRVRRCKIGEPFSHEKHVHDAKKIHAWMLFNLPQGTYKALVQLIELEKDA